MFIDRVKIIVQGGDGGKGCVSFRREKYVPRGGPDGGNGGDGGDVILRVDAGISTLLDLKYTPLLRAGRGVHGKGKNLYGKRGEERVVLVPPGTLVIDDDTDELLADLVNDGDSIIAAHGGRGGRGNASLSNARNRLPRFAELGLPGERRALRLDLRIIADIAIVGFPNSGKSTLLSRISDAHPKIDDYPFTTLSPNLGVVDTNDYTRFVVADIPGLIEGAHEGVGLGHDFLRHIERTRVLVFLLDASGPDASEDYETLMNELSLHDPKLIEKPRIVVANKMDLPSAKENWADISRRLKKKNESVIPISALDGVGLEKLIESMKETVDKQRELAPAGTPRLEFEKRYTYRPEFSVRKRGNVFELSGAKPEKWAQMTDFENWQAVRHLCHKLGRLGIESALKREGAEGAIVLSIEGHEIEYQLG